MEVLALIAQGKSNQEISTELYLALNTVKRHAYNIYSKLEVNKRLTPFQERGNRAWSLNFPKSELTLL